MLVRWLICGFVGSLLPMPANADDPTAPVSDAGKAWRLDTGSDLPALYHEAAVPRKWANVSPIELLKMAKLESDPAFYEQNCALSPLDSDRAWMAVSISPAWNMTRIEYTATGGKQWVEMAGPPADDSISLSFLDEKTGFVMTADGQLGNHHEHIFRTTDGGRHWNEMPSPTRHGTSYYATGIVFRTPLQGWITATYHGAPDAPLLHTIDGGQSWEVQAFEIPADYRGGYANTYPPAFYGKDKLHGILPVKLVRHTPLPDHEADVLYETEDGGTTWHLPHSLKP